MKRQEILRWELTKLIDDSECSYEQLIRELKRQIFWLEKARKDEHGRGMKAAVTRGKTT